MFNYPMMRGYYGSPNGAVGNGNYTYPMFSQNTGFLWLHMILAAITWMVVIALLIALARWLWYKGDREKKREIKISVWFYLCNITGFRNSCNNLPNI